MTITVAPARNELTANAGQTIFNYTFKIFSITDLNVYITPTGQNANDSTDLTTAYTVLGVGDEDGGTITLTTGATLNDLITIVSNTPSSRTTDYQNNGDFRPDTVNADFDRVVSLVKKIEDVTNRGLVSPQSKQGPKPLSLPDPVAGELLRWIGDLSGLENVSLNELPTGVFPVDRFSLNYSTLAEAIADATLQEGDVLHVAERILSNGGPFIADVKLLSSVTPSVGEPAIGNIVTSTGVPTLAIELRIDEEVTNSATWGAVDGAEASGAIKLMLAGMKKPRIDPNHANYLIIAELNPAASTKFDLSGSSLIAHPDIPSVDNVIRITNSNVTVENGGINGNRDNLNNPVISGVTSCCLLVHDGGDGARINGVSCNNAGSSGYIVVGQSGNVDDVEFNGCSGDNNAVSGTGGEAQVNGSPLTNIRWINGESSNNDLGGDIRIQGVDGFVIDGYNVLSGDHGALNVGVGEAKNPCRGSINNSSFSNSNPGLPTAVFDAKVGAGAFNGQVGQLEVRIDNTTFIGAGTGTGLNVINGALVTGGTVTSRDHTNNLVTDSGSLTIIDNFISQNSVSAGLDLRAPTDILNVVVETWGAAVNAVTFRTGSETSRIRGRFGAVIAESGTHDGANNAAVMTDSTATFIVDEHVGKVIRNTTDGSKSTITSNTSTTVTGVLTGGTDDDWDTNDAYEITKETGKDGVVQVGSPADIEVEVVTFTGTGTAVGLVSGAIANTWEINDRGANNMLELIDGIAAPAAEVGRAKMYINVSNGDLEIIFGDGTTKTIVTDT